MDERARVAERLRWAEKALRRAQEAHDGTEAARRRYRAARARLALLEALAAQLLGVDARPGP